ncbi:hypothetical protein [Burkholderia thailandensis]|uniref:hypothetical protein n=1 Tax=Burkholderia thailandensis TaxID=57975 RepID=UPI0003ECAF0A|nr:hypothetical protein [Burkholderia thailandensis]AHI63025.1 hypothetical protein BTL_276 [Burkholderia thailandensis H0587]MCZ2897010.1 hypothetical protein [Burkholderia thailandensis]
MATNNNIATHAAFGTFAGQGRGAGVMSAHTASVVNLAAFRARTERNAPSHVGGARVLSMADYGAENIEKRRNLVRHKLLATVCDPDDAPVAYVAAFMHGDGRCTIAGDGVEREFAGMLSDGLSALMGKLERHGAGLPVTG